MAQIKIAIAALRLLYHRIPDFDTGFFRHFPQSFQKSVRLRLTAVSSRGMIPSKLNRLDRGAGSISTLRQGQAAAGGERGNRRSSGKLPGGPVLGRQRTSAGLSQSYFVKRYHWLRRESPLWGAPFVYSMNRLTKRFIFCFPPHCGGRGGKPDHRRGERF